MLGVCSTNAVEDEGFTLEIACELIGGTPQKEGIQVMSISLSVNTHYSEKRHIENTTSFVYVNS